MISRPNIFQIFEVFVRGVTLQYKINYSKFYLRGIVTPDKLHNELELLLVKDIVKQELIIFTHNFFSNSLPPVFDIYFEKFDHPYPTRNGIDTITKMSFQGSGYAFFQQLC